MTDKVDMTPEEIVAELFQFSGSGSWHQFNGMWPWVIATSGAMEMANLCGAYWLLELVASHQKKICRRHGYAGLEFQNWTIKLRPRAGGCIVSCDDGNGKKLSSQTVPYTDFPIKEFSFYCNMSRRDPSLQMTILLKNEY